MSDDDKKPTRVPMTIDPGRDPMSAMLGLLLGGDMASFAESEGQDQVVSMDVLPTHIYGSEEAFKAPLQSKGGTWGEPLIDDPLFTHVKLPLGWTKVPTDHDMWSEVHDETGKVVARVFYKAAFYDRKAHLTPQI